MVGVRKERKHTKRVTIDNGGNIHESGVINIESDSTTSPEAISSAHNADLSKSESIDSPVKCKRKPRALKRQDWMSDKHWKKLQLEARHGEPTLAEENYIPTQMEAVDKLVELAQAKEYNYQKRGVKTALDIERKQLADAHSGIIVTPPDLSSRFWRLNNLYWIIDEQGKKVHFRMNDAQRRLWDDRHYLNIIPKARQLGFSTFIDIMALDSCLFTSNFAAGIIAHTRLDAQRLFATKVKFPYDHLPNEIKNLRPADTKNVQELKFNNDSSIYVGVSMRSGTLNFLHVSELGKISAENPEKAREIKTGALNTVHAKNIIFIESTSEGAEGDFYEFCERAHKLQLNNEKLTDMDFKLHFFPWHENPKYRLDPEGVIIYPYLQEYFEDLKLRYGISLDDSQKAWYAKKIEVQGEDMYREMPSVYEEVFRISNEGAYYRKQFLKIYEDKRICPVPYMDGYPVDAIFDIGVGDDTAIWFTQTVGRELHAINYYENGGEGLGHYADFMWDLKRSDNYRYGKFIAPFDIANREWGNNAESRLQSAANLGINFTIAPKLSIEDGIEQVRQTLASTWFDEEKCQVGIKHLENYKKEWDKKRGVWKNSPSHDSHSHGASAFRYRAITWREVTREQKVWPKQKHNNMRAFI